MIKVFVDWLAFRLYYSSPLRSYSSMLCSSKFRFRSSIVFKINRRLSATLLIWYDSLCGPDVPLQPSIECERVEDATAECCRSRRINDIFCSNSCRGTSEIQKQIIFDFAAQTERFTYLHLPRDFSAADPMFFPSRFSVSKVHFVGNIQTPHPDWVRFQWHEILGRQVFQYYYSRWCSCLHFVWARQWPARESFWTNSASCFPCFECRRHSVSALHFDHFPCPILRWKNVDFGCGIVDEVLATSVDSD